MNKPGYVVSALQNGWKLPGWCYRSEQGKNDAQNPPVAPQASSLPAGGWLEPASDIPPDWEDRRRESPHAKLWNRMCGTIQGKIQPESFTAWIQPCYIADISEGVITLAAPNRVVAEWVEEHYMWLIRWTFGEVDERIQIK